MNLLGFWLLTILASKGIEIGVFYTKLKDIAKEGYKVNIDACKNLLFPSNDASYNALSLIPVLNIILAMSDAMFYFSDKGNFLDTLHVFGDLQYLTEEENKYVLNPTIGNIYKLYKMTNEQKNLEENILLAKQVAEKHQEEIEELKANFLKEQENNLLNEEDKTQDKELKLTRKK